MSTSRFLFSNGVFFNSSDTPPVTTFLETLPGAYTTTRSHENGSRLLFWERHLNRLCDSVRILSNSHPKLLFGDNRPSDFSRSFWELELRCLVNDSVSKVLPIAMEERTDGEELSITALVTGSLGKVSEIGNLGRERAGNVLDVYVHVGIYAPTVFGIRENGANLAVVGRRREAAEAKYSDWVRMRKPLEKLRPPSATELLLSNDGDRLLEGSVSNFFVVCREDKGEARGKCLDEKEIKDCFEVQTAPLRDGVLPGIIRQLVIDVCLTKGIPFREVAPSWSEHEIWEEAFITNSLRILQHVETISIPDSWDSLHSKSWKEISWNNMQFELSCKGLDDLPATVFVFRLPLMPRQVPTRHGNSSNC
ncbi:uncharacterized protein LOC21397270 isoform X1 [Morus notabilis]|uniref:uncharacterized protein LOC21397270 isoform X1 n=1 Tax=Morus notabilis TaxID=981085 RepID=UPI000CED3E90|nr:uncharacterized protein LOC21397270 isoform X1 [Morus notabilis]